MTPNLTRRSPLGEMEKFNIFLAAKPHSEKTALEGGMARELAVAWIGDVTQADPATIEHRRSPIRPSRGGRGLEACITKARGRLSFGREVCTLTNKVGTISPNQRFRGFKLSRSK